MIKESPIRGIALEDLVYLLKNAKAELDSLDLQQTLYLSSKEGDVYGALLPGESKEIRLRTRDRIQKRIDEIREEIRRKVAVNSD